MYAISTNNTVLTTIHKGIPDWDIRLIDSAFTEKSLRSKELFWQYKLQTFHPDGLNEYEAPVDTT